MNIVAEHGCQCQRTHSLRERHQSRTHHGKAFPFWTPVERIVLAIRRLWNQDGVRSSSCFHKVMRSNICHNLCPRINFGVEFLLQLPQRLLIKILIHLAVLHLLDVGQNDTDSSRREKVSAQQRMLQQLDIPNLRKKTEDRRGYLCHILPHIPTSILQAGYVLTIISIRVVWAATRRGIGSRELHYWERLVKISSLGVSISRNPGRHARWGKSLTLTTSLYTFRPRKEPRTAGRVALSPSFLCGVAGSAGVYG